MMKTTILCDDVFEVLTAGPFPSGKAIDGPISEHLGDCQACQQLADALRPACYLLHESLPAHETEGLPVFCDDDECRALEANLQAVMQRIEPHRVREGFRATRGVRGSGARSRRILAGLCVAMLLMLLVFGGGPWRGNAGNNSGHWLPLDSIHFGASCLVDSAAAVGKRSTNLRTPQYVCCTSCHTAHRTTDRGPAAQSLLASCGNCHPR